jgi:hypothetical protein
VTMTNGAYPHYLTGYFKIYLKRLPECDFFCFRLAIVLSVFLRFTASEYPILQISLIALVTTLVGSDQGEIYLSW